MHDYPDDLRIVAVTVREKVRRIVASRKLGSDGR